jgi:hypothetical protein
LEVPIVQLGGDFKHGGRMETFWCQYLNIGNSIVLRTTVRKSLKRSRPKWV